MFIQNKYFKWYNQIITQAKALKNFRITGYFEKHHILPRSLGGTNNQDNIVKLTAREHFVCHRLLVKCTSGKNKSKMARAVFRTSHRSKNHKDLVKITSKAYEQIKKDFSIAQSHLNKGKKPYEMTDKIRSNMSKARMGVVRIQSDEEKQLRSINQKGRFVSEQTKAKISFAHKGKINGPRTEEIKKAISNSNTGKHHTVETKDNLSKTIKNLYDSDPTYKDRISKSVSIANTGKVWMHLGCKNKFVTKDQALQLLKDQDQWVYGRFIAKRRTKLEMHNVLKSTVM
jgi:hypothetical protein